MSTAVEIAIRTHDLPHDWPQGVLREADQFTDHINTDDIAGREDIRNLPLITIDGKGAKDFDDAVYCEPQGSGWRLLIAIADVSHYVKTGTAIDAEALHRGNSVYFPRLVIPMLPEILSNNICSLSPQSDRLCVVCELHVNCFGMVKRYRFFEGIMNSAARVTYSEFANIIAKKNSQLLGKYADLHTQFESLYQLFLLLHGHRKKNGLLDFTSIEPHFTFDNDEHVVEIHTLQRNDAHRLIEEFMLRANVAAAKFVLKNKIPALYRVHDKPEHDSLDSLHDFLADLKLKIGGRTNPTAKDYATLIDRVKERKYVHTIEMALLRSMQLAVYSEKNRGHFALAFSRYTHFTSPIRRYSDLIIHRCIRHLIHHQPVADFAYSVKNMAEFAKQCSLTNRRAEKASRDVIQWYKCEFMQSRIGNIYQGTINGVVPFGVFVELDDIYVDGLIHIKALPMDYYHFDPVSHRLTGNRKKKTFCLGDRVKVRVTGVNIDDGKIDFKLAG